MAYWLELLEESLSLVIRLVVAQCQFYYVLAERGGRRSDGVGLLLKGSGVSLLVTS